jgi:chaperone modulatory protein CbpM
MAEFERGATETVVVEEHVSFILLALCQASGADPAQVHALVGEGLLQPAGRGPADWRFSGDALPQTRKALRLASGLDIGLPGVAIVLELLAEIERLRRR